ncbi:hypothetical protein CHARACLAT_026531 [Characodon lateralis]|uniref:Uncharacterized protein n=1 Tax=Characodon lateralis TaxID=208331 RepID=A0ABU7E555_9TELE|nr:hypothetical protein [Characodon lateralis]
MNLVFVPQSFPRWKDRGNRNLLKSLQTPGQVKIKEYLVPHMQGGPHFSPNDRCQSGPARVMTRIRWWICSSSCVTRAGSVEEEEEDI